MTWCKTGLQTTDKTRTWFWSPPPSHLFSLRVPIPYGAHLFPVEVPAQLELQQPSRAHLLAMHLREGRGVSG
jgi:hypothetical protein